jgi:tRNA (guanine9-N1)-methyltransferase
MHSQLTFLYSHNRTSARPFSNVLHTSFSPEASPRLYKAMENSRWDRWSRASWWGGSIGDLVNVMSGRNPSQTMTPPKLESKETPTPEAEQMRAHLSDPNIPDGWEGHKLIYLSADAEEELETLQEDEVYIIGGLVDRNRHKASSVPTSHPLSGKLMPE